LEGQALALEVGQGLALEVVLELVSELAWEGLELVLAGLVEVLEEQDCHNQRCSDKR
jgi:hypothetical protein